MPTVTKVNPTLRNVARSFNGKTVQQYQVDLVADASAELGPGEAVEAVLRAFAERATVIMHSELTDSNTQMTVFVEGEFPTDTYDGETSESFGTYVESVIDGLGSTYGPNDFDMTDVTVTDGTVYFADDVQEDY